MKIAIRLIVADLSRNSGRRRHLGQWNASLVPVIATREHQRELQRRIMRMKVGNALEPRRTPVDANVALSGLMRIPSPRHQNSNIVRGWQVVSPADRTGSRGLRGMQTKNHVRDRVASIRCLPEQLAGIEKPSRERVDAVNHCTEMSADGQETFALGIKSSCAGLTSGQV